MIVSIALVLEIVLGFVSMDNNRIYGFAFMAVLVVAVIFQIGSASLMVEYSKDLTSGADKQDDLNAHYFFLYASPIPTRILLAFMKYRDIGNAGAQ